MGAAGDVVLRAGPVSVFGEGTYAVITPANPATVTAPEVTDTTKRMGVTGEVNVAFGRFQPAARVSYYSDSSLGVAGAPGSWTQVLGGLIVHAGLKGSPDIVRVGAGYVLRLESDPVPNDTVRLWVQARI